MIYERKMKKVFKFTLIALICILLHALFFNTYASTLGTDEEYTEIWTVQDLYKINLDLSKNYILMKDLDMTEDTTEGGAWCYDNSGLLGWRPLGDSATENEGQFTGIFDGNNHVIKGMKIKYNNKQSSTWYQLKTMIGLFKNNAGTIKNLSMVDYEINCTEQEWKEKNGTTYVGVICGKNTGTIENCSIKEGNVYVHAKSEYQNEVQSELKLYEGGICGKNENIISRCYNLGKISGVAYNYSYYGGTDNYQYRRGYPMVGGIAGGNIGNISLCYNSGEIISKQYKSNITDTTDYCVASIAINEDGGSVQNTYNTGTLDGTIKTTSYKNYYNAGVENEDAENYYFLSETGKRDTLTEPQMKLDFMFQTFDFENVWVIDDTTDYSYPQLINNRQSINTDVEKVEFSDLEKVDYILGEKFDRDDITVTVYHKSGKSEKVTDFNVTGFGNSKEENTVTVEYKGFSKQYTVYIHELKEWETTKEPTCEEEGEEALVCKYCSKEIEKRKIAAVGHKWDEGKVTTEPTCTEEGEKTFTCQNNKSHTYTEKVDAVGHEYTSKVTEPTCTEKGYTTYTCTRCGDSYVSDLVSAKGHTAASPVVENKVEATCTEEGLYDSVVYCKDCKSEISREKQYVPALEHNWDNEVITKKPTCTEEGEKTYTCQNDKSHTYTEKIKSLGHNYISRVTEPTCTEKGYTTYTCSRCSDSYVSDETPAKGHTAASPVVENKVEATCTIEGSYDTVVYCRECKYEISREKTKIPAKGHTALKPVVENEIEATCTEKGSYDSVVYCKDCKSEISREKQYVPALEHNWDNGVITKKQTCTEEGEKTYTCRNDKSHKRIEFIPETGHNYVTKVKEPTCTENGYTTYFCTNCGDSYKSNYVPAEEHEYETTVTKATLSENGVIETKCSKCEDTKSTKIIYYPKTIAFSPLSFTYDGKAHAPNVVVKGSDGKEINKDCYNISYSKGRVDTGIYNVTITFKGNYTGTLTKKFTIIPSQVKNAKVKTQKEKEITLQWSKNAGNVTGYKIYEYNPKTKKYEYKSKTTNVNYTIKKLTPGTSYKYRIVAYKTIDKKDYESKVVELTTNTIPNTTKIKSIKTKNKSVTLKWNKIKDVEGYEIYMSTNKNKNYERIKRINKANTVDYTKSKLKKNKKYYFKIRTFKTINGKRIYGNYSSIKEIKVK